MEKEARRNMIVEAIRKFIEYQQRVRIYSDEYREYDQAVAGNVTARHYRNKKNWSGPQEYLVCKKREAYRKMIRACDQYQKYHDALRQHLKDVPSDTLRRIIWLRFYYSKSWEDIGRRVHLSPAAAKMRWHRYQNVLENQAVRENREIKNAAG